MATVIQIKRSSSTSAPATLKLGELAFTYGTGTQGNLGDRLFIGEGGVDGNGDANNISVIGGQYFAEILDHVQGTLTANGAVIIDSNKAIDEFIVGNSTSVGGTIKFNEGTNNGTNFVGLKAPNLLSATTTFALPGADGTAGQFLKTDGAGNLEFMTVNQYIDLAGDTGTDTYNTAETLTFAGGAGMDTVVTDNNVEIQANTLTDSNLSGSAGISNSNLANPTTTLGSSVLTLGATETDIAGLTSLVIDDITIDGQSVTTTAANKNINLTPHGTGTVILPSGYEDRAGFQNQSVANKAYVDQVAQGLDTKPSCKAATTADLVATYNNGTLGVGATLTADFNGAISVDDIALSVNDRLLVKDQTDATENGIYKVDQVGTGSTPFVLTRATPEDQPSELSGGSFVFVEEGTIGSNNGYTFTHTGQPTFGTTDLDVSQFSGAGQITAGAGLIKDGNTIDTNPDNSSIEVSGDQIRVKPLGVQNSMVANNTLTGEKFADPLYFKDESSTQGQVSIGGTLEFLAGEGINTIASGNQLQIVGELASTSNIGVASFSADNFTITAGDVEVTTVDGGTF
ncbi:uncharacterized protein METZ01_LOCUS11723 [marine metagenome]|uniref:Major tropism determinant N-terminal domain-containing protein n=1 Tax=marine metagenome TaxID=408172 RepID=A0A381NXA8_9ZZZZ